MGKPRLSGAKPLPRATQAPSQTRTRRYSHTRGPAAPSALLGSLVLRVLGSQGRGGAAPGGTLEGEARGQPAAGGDANTPGAGALRAADTDREGRGCGRAGEGRGAERKGGVGNRKTSPRAGAVLGVPAPAPSWCVRPGLPGLILFALRVRAGVTGRRTAPLPSLRLSPSGKPESWKT